MRNILVIGFAVLMLISIVVWIVGLLTAAIFPWFGGVRAESVGQIGFAAAGFGECFTYIFGWLSTLSEKRRSRVMGLPGPKKYGNKKPVA